MGKVCRVDITVGDQVLQKQAVTQPGTSLGWSTCLSFDLMDPVERGVLTDQISRCAGLTHRDTLYIPPEVREGMLVSGILVKEAKVVRKIKETKEGDNHERVPVLAATAEAPVIETAEKSEGQGDYEEEVNANTQSDEAVRVEEENEHDEVAAEEVEENRELILEKDEVEGGSLGGSAETEGKTELPVHTIREGMPMEGMIADTNTDPSLTTILKLASLDKEGYHMSNGLAFRTRLDTFGTPQEQLCVPQKYRQQCLRLHTPVLAIRGEIRWWLFLGLIFTGPAWLGIA